MEKDSTGLRLPASHISHTAKAGVHITTVLSS